MQDIIKHNEHTDGYCRACTTYSEGQKLAQSYRRVQTIIRDIFTGLEECTHPNTRLSIEPDVMDDNGDFNGGWRYKVCRDCLTVVEVS